MLTDLVSAPTEGLSRDQHNGFVLTGLNADRTAYTVLIIDIGFSINYRE